MIFYSQLIHLLSRSDFLGMHSISGLSGGCYSSIVTSVNLQRSSHQVPLVILLNYLLGKTQGEMLGPKSIVSLPGFDYYPLIQPVEFDSTVHVTYSKLLATLRPMRTTKHKRFTPASPPTLHSNPASVFSPTPPVSQSYPPHQCYYHRGPPAPLVRSPETQSCLAASLA